MTNPASTTTSTRYAIVWYDPAVTSHVLMEQGKDGSWSVVTYDTERKAKNAARRQMNEPGVIRAEYVPHNGRRRI